MNEGNAPAGPAGGAAGEVPAFDKVAVLGHALWVMSQSPAHRYLFLADMEWALMPPVALGQFRLWRENNMPVGFATWAYLSEEAEARALEGVQRLKPTDWKSGDRLWLMELITPFGGRENALEDLKTNIFKGATVKTFAPDPEAGKPRIVEI
ncbi:MAG: toxin-activating lysine-acyltransferase [Pirellulales bacterium]|nr:toxin-activating lysine-acyltransferase [Pirellulales bacterium]